MRKAVHTTARHSRLLGVAAGHEGLAQVLLSFLQFVLSPLLDRVTVGLPLHDTVKRLAKVASLVGRLGLGAANHHLFTFVGAHVEGLCADRQTEKEQVRSSVEATSRTTTISLTVYISRLVRVTDSSVAHFGEQAHPLLVCLRHLEMVTKATHTPIYTVPHSSDHKSAQRERLGKESH